MAFGLFYVNMYARLILYLMLKVELLVVIT